MKKIIEFIRYSIFGGITTVLNLLLFALFESCGIYYIIANAIAYIIAVIINFMLNKYFVFIESTGKSSVSQFFGYLTIRGFSLLIDSFLFFLLVDAFKINVYISRVGLSFILILLTFVMNKKLIFK